MEVKYLLMMLSALFYVCNAVIIRNNHRNDRRDDNIRSSSNIVQRRTGSDRVQIRVYRGPETEYGGKTFAPWGFLVRQPADD